MANTKRTRPRSSLCWVSAMGTTARLRIAQAPQRVLGTFQAVSYGSLYPVSPKDMLATD